MSFWGPTTRVRGVWARETHPPWTKKICIQVKNGGWGVGVWARKTHPPLPQQDDISVNKITFQGIISNIKHHWQHPTTLKEHSKDKNEIKIITIVISSFWLTNFEAVRPKSNARLKTRHPETRRNIMRWQRHAKITGGMQSKIHQNTTMIS